MIKSILWMMGSVFSLCLMAVAGRELSGIIDIFQILFFRSLVGLFLITIIILLAKKQSTLQLQILVFIWGEMFFTF